MALRNARRPDSEWLAIITEARNSGLTDREWCEAHGISKNTFYTAVDRLRKKACNVPDPQRRQVIDFTANKQEVVQIGIQDKTEQAEVMNSQYIERNAAPAVEIKLPRCTIKISDTASPALVNALISSMGDLL